MKWLLRPSPLLALAVIAVLAAGILIFQSYVGKVQQGPLPVNDEEEEIVWLYPATNTSSWTLFVTALRQAKDRLQEQFPGLEAQITESTYPEKSTTIPEIRLNWPGSSHKLVFRWYKLTSERNIDVWVSELMQRDKPPLAIIGGSSSDLATVLAKQMQKHSQQLSPDRRPLLFITTATADRAALNGDFLEKLYPNRTFRFCFTNQQMADAVTRFIWNNDELRPDRDPLYFVSWLDNGYSRDLSVRFDDSLQAYLANASAQEWLWLTGSLGKVGSPLVPTGAVPLERLGKSEVGVSFSIPPSQFGIPSSIGMHDIANRFETEDARNLLQDLETHCEQERSLLFVTGSTEPTRRFLRSLVRESPEVAKRLVVATGDAMSFNTVYRDRRWNWPIQDLPFPLVFFRHQNPIDVEAGFQPLDGDRLLLPAGQHLPKPRDREGQPDFSPGTGTETVLLFGDIATALTLGYYQNDSHASNPADLADRMRTVHYFDGTLTTEKEGTRLFNDLGGRSPNTGEHLVYVRPIERSGHLRGEAAIEVWRTGATSKTGQKLIATLIAHCD